MCTGVCIDVTCLVYTCIIPVLYVTIVTHVGHSHTLTRHQLTADIRSLYNVPVRCQLSTPERSVWTGNVTWGTGKRARGRWGNEGYVIRGQGSLWGEWDGGG